MLWLMQTIPYDGTNEKKLWLISPVIPCILPWNDLEKEGVNQLRCKFHESRILLPAVSSASWRGVLNIVSTQLWILIAFSLFGDAYGNWVQVQASHCPVILVLNWYFGTVRPLNTSQLFRLVGTAICSNISDTTGCVGLTGWPPRGVWDIFKDDFNWC